MEIVMEKWRATLVPQSGIRCRHCTEKHEEETHPDAYTTQIPRAVVVFHSKESIIFREQNFCVTSLRIETNCEVCGGINIYPLNFWEENEVKENKKKEADGGV